ncbi:GyrI-like domain-containing protein [Dyadobacter psychrophilus]|uniref:GyrI-like small molecule binding domain-containing protein n=1 Tax=Dyadobacter psychrophilus TaxID=651661 RepID=A0A1T5H8E3_9BACT|nr:GyrI-like domain-containing protein [Dyadobacter psychrophilus]SKC16973.1 GyrI-like small molecule binding domain-containing protein [Dyadobacter psychrophilus]
MQTKTIPPIHVLYFETETSLNELMDYVRLVAHRLYREAIRKEMEVTGPIYWIYNGADGNPETRFHLTIALPVTVSDTPLTDSEFKLKYLEPFRCVAGQLYGSWEGLGKIYGDLISALMSENLIMTGQNREIYLNMDFQNPENNITEIQIGIN